MKKVLFLMDSLGAGGAEKSFITLLNTLPADNYQIELILIRKSGLFLPQLPAHIKILENIFPYQFLGISPKNILLYLKYGISFWIKKIIRYQKAKLNKNYAIPQTLWKLWEKDIPVLQKKYDVVISYLEGITNYYAIEKIQAKRKILWIHNEYKKLGYNNTFDAYYFKKADNIITISELCKKNLIESFPNLPKDKFVVVENITNVDLVKKLSQEKINDSLFNNATGEKLLSIGRLTYQKGYDLALESAAKLKEKGINFSWFIIGEGELRKELEQLKHKLNLDDNVFFIGIRSNPYNYMRQADIIIQSSRFEGKSIAIDEAKILCKPIISTNYNTIGDLIQNNINGIITDMTPEALANGIAALINDIEKRKELSQNLQKETHNNKANEINKYISIIENNTINQ